MARGPKKRGGGGARQPPSRGGSEASGSEASGSDDEGCLCSVWLLAAAAGPALAVLAAVILLLRTDGLAALACGEAWEPPPEHMLLERCDIDVLPADRFSLEDFSARYSLRRPVLLRNSSVNAEARAYLADRCSLVSRYGSAPVDVGDPYSLSKHGVAASQTTLREYLDTPFSASHPLYWFDREGRWTEAMPSFQALLSRPPFVSLEPAERRPADEHLRAFLLRGGLEQWEEAFVTHGVDSPAVSARPTHTPQPPRSG